MARPFFVIAVLLSLLGLSIGTVSADAATPSTVDLTIVPGSTTLAVSWTLHVGTDGATGITLGRDGTDASGNGPWTFPTSTGTSGSGTFTNLVTGRPYNVTAQPVNGSTQVGTSTVLAAVPGSGQTVSSTGTPPPPPPATGACTVSGATGAGAPTKTVNVAAPSGDMTAAIRSALSSASGGGKVVLQAGTYTISGSLSIPSGVDLTGAGTGSTTIKAADTANVDPMVTVPGGTSNVTVEKLTVNQNGASAASRQSLSAYMVEARGTNVIFQNVATRMPSTYSMVAAGANKFCFRNNNVLNDPALNGKYNQEDGIHILNSSNGDVVNNYVDNSYNGATSGDDGLVAHAYGGPVSNVTYKGNVVRGGKNGIGMAIWDYNNNVTGITVTQNEFWGEAGVGHGNGYGGDTGSFANSTITNNNLHNLVSPLSVAGSGLTVTGNRLCSAGTANVTGSGNTVSNNTQYTGCTNAPTTQSPPPVIP